MLANLTSLDRVPLPPLEQRCPSLDVDLPLSDVLRENPNPTREIELWKVAKGERKLTCIAVYLSNGIDVRLMEGDGFKRTQLVRDAIECTALSDEWKRKLTPLGWSDF